ncbi:myoglobin-like [Polypterus senegalus]|uniref:myoglobin-like n=1 Tax=Polypterus senegalus TaxID=55291 RepID=UPI0019643DDD|nr:myoglobin-like [Polypterus senegalus]URH10230.1 myoglobin [Polypterus senegalus]
MALSEGEWGLVLKAWGNVESDPAGVGQAVLLRLFHDHKETQNHFPKFKNLSAAELQSSGDVRTHGQVVVNKLTELLKKKGNHADILKPLAESHSKKHKIPVQNFELISEVIVKVMSEKMPDFGADGQAALRKALKVVVTDLGNLYEC